MTNRRQLTLEQAEAEVAASAGCAPAAGSRFFSIQEHIATSVLGRQKTFFRAIDDATGKLITTSPTRRCAESVAVNVYGYAPIPSENS